MATTARAHRRGAPLTLPAATLAATSLVALALAGCRGDDGDDAGDDAAEVGELAPVADGGNVGDGVDAAAGPDGVWLALDDGRVVSVSGDEVEPAAAIDEVSTDTGIAAGPDGTLVATDPDRTRLLRYRDGEVELDDVDGVQQFSELAVDGDRVYVGDYDAARLLIVQGADGEGSVETVLENTLAGPMAVAPDGTLYFVDDQLFNGRIRALHADGQASTVTGEVERDDDGDPVERPTNGASADDSYIEALDIAATDDGLFVLTFDNEVWRIADDELELVLRRGDDSALTALAAWGDDLYVLDTGTATLSTLE